MSNQPLVYCVDASALIDLKDTHRPCNYPGVWNRLGDLVNQGRLVTVDLVKEECKDPELKSWFKEYPRIIKAYSKQIEECVKRIMTDVAKSGKQLVDYDKDCSNADPFIIACAMAGNFTESGEFASGSYVLVQHEKPANKSSTKVKIPDVCEWYKIKQMKIYELIYREGWIFR